MSASAELFRYMKYILLLSIRRIIIMYKRVVVLYGRPELCLFSLTGSTTAVESAVHSLTPRSRRRFITPVVDRRCRSHPSSAAAEQRRRPRRMLTYYYIIRRKFFPHNIII